MGPRRPLTQPAPGLGRRQLLQAAALAAAGCSGDAAMPAAPARWLDDGQARGHRLRDKSGSLPAAAVQRRSSVVVVGAGVAGLAAARAFAQAGVDDVHVLELAAQPGGHSRGHVLAGMACPLGAHYLPLPGPVAHEVSEFLHEQGLLRSVLGRTVADERHLCHSPQERLFIDGAWADGLLPPADPASRTQAQYRAFAARVRQAQALGFALPSTRAPWTPDHAALDSVRFGDWLAGEGLDDERLRWYLDYCCRDDYGAGLQQVSAWAGLHYFASRHGFEAPGDDGGAVGMAGTQADGEAVFTWPEGNAWLVQRLAEPLAGRLHTGRVVLQVDEGRHGVALKVWDDSAGRVEAWQADRVVLAVPMFVALRLLARPPAALETAAAAMTYAPWLVANLHLDKPLLDRPGVLPSWDNVAYGSAGLGWVDAMHQSLRTAPGPTVLTVYRSLLPAERPALLQGSAEAWAATALGEIAAVHPDLPRRLKQVDLMRWGHAMAIPVPGLRGSVQSGPLAALRRARGRVRFAHGDLGGSSVFEEAFTLGHAVARG